MSRILIALLATAIATQCVAEVRVEQRPEGPALQIGASGRGIWAPAPGGRAVALNPDGDALGDSYPVHANSRSRLLVGWARILDGTIQLAEYESAYTSRRYEISAGEVSGLPLLTATPSGWFILWQPAHSQEVRGAFLSAGEVRWQGSLATGTLAGAVKAGSDVVVVTWDAALHELHESLVTFRLNPIPIPVITAVVRIPVATTSTDGLSPEYCSATSSMGAVIAVKVGDRAYSVTAIEGSDLYGPSAFDGNGSCSSVLRRAAP